MLDLNNGFSARGFDLEWPVFHVASHLAVEVTTDEAFSIEDSVLGVRMERILSWVADAVLAFNRYPEDDAGERLRTVVRHQ